MKRVLLAMTMLVSSTWGCGSGSVHPAPKRQVRTTPAVSSTPEAASTPVPTAPTDAPQPCEASFAAVHLRSDLASVAAACDAQHINVLGRGQPTRLVLPASPRAATGSSTHRIDVIWAHDSRTLAVVRNDGIRFWSADSRRWIQGPDGAPLRLASPRGDELLAGVAFHPTKNLVAIFNRVARLDLQSSGPPAAGHVFIYDVKTGSQVAHFTDTEPIGNVTWHPDGHHILAGGGTHSSGNLWAWWGKKLRVWNIQTNKRLADWKGHSAFFSADGLRVAIEIGHRRGGSTNQWGNITTGASVEVWDVATLRLLGRAVGKLSNWSPDLKEVVLDHGVRDSSYFRWKVGPSRPTAIQSQSSPASSVSSTPTAIADPTAGLNLPAWWNQGSWGSRVVLSSPHVLVKHSEAKLLRTETGRGLMLVGGPSDDGTCQTALVERATDQQNGTKRFVGDAAAAMGCWASAANDDPPTLTDELLLDVVDGKPAAK